MPEIQNKIIIKKCFIYSFKIWLVNDLLLLGLVFNLSPKIDNFPYIQFVILIPLIFLINSTILGVFSYILIKSNLNHWFKKILLLLIAILITIIFSYVIFRETEFYGDKIYLGIACIFSIPTLFTVGLFYPDKLDEELRREKG